MKNPWPYLKGITLWAAGINFMILSPDSKINLQTFFPMINTFWCCSIYVRSFFFILRVLVHVLLQRKRSIESINQRNDEKFSYGYSKTTTEGSILTNQNRRRQTREPIKIRSKYMQPEQRAGKRAWANHHPVQLVLLLIGRESGKKCLNQSLS